ncbi:MAG TPA: OB-fold nucleic acid binding domain-containing protein, partial [Smithella sp.]|nr:OB-fold nucleic acid binding domain-containing protein [Smithella sp.]
MNYSQRIFCGQLSMEHVGRTVQLCGWVDAYRDHGGLLFIHLRDRSGIIQIVFSPDFTSTGICQAATALRPEYCVAITGKAKKRLEGTENPNIETGQLEVLVDDMTVLSEADPLPFVITDKAMVAGAETAGGDNVSEDLRMQYRYLDIRRPAMQNNLILRHRIFQCVRQFLDSRGFVEVETPVL